ncbi:MAG: type II secretion system protein [Planctomycetota bacterium]
MKKKGFTLVELLVVIAIIALLMSILMPALARVRQIAYRMICGTNLSGIGKAGIVYANDHNERYPRAGGRKALWDTDAKLKDWSASSWEKAFGANLLAEIPGTATVTSSHYLLVKYADVSPKQFVCKGDSGIIPFKVSDFQSMGLTVDQTSVHDFGPLPVEHCSYTYQMPYTADLGGSGPLGERSFPVSMVHNPSAPVASDRNPFQDENAETYIAGYTQYVNLSVMDVQVGGQTVKQYTFVDPDQSVTPAPPDNSPYGNSNSHQREGQNVLYVDAHVTFEKHPNVGIENDNIWVHWREADVTASPTGKPYDPELLQIGFVADSPNPRASSPGGKGRPMGQDDAFLANDTSSVVQ